MNKDEEYLDSKAGIKKWITKTVLLGCLLVLLVFGIEYYFDIPLLVDSLIAITIVLILGFLHEGLHYYQAVKLGYQTRWYRTKFTMGFEITHHSSRGKWVKDKKKIATLPYIVIVPLSCFIMLFGYNIGSFGITIAGIVSLILHAITFKREGVQVG